VVQAVTCSSQTNVPHNRNVTRLIGCTKSCFIYAPLCGTAVRHSLASRTLLIVRSPCASPSIAFVRSLSVSHSSCFSAYLHAPIVSYLVRIRIVACFESFIRQHGLGSCWRSAGRRRTAHTNPRLARGQCPYRVAHPAPPQQIPRTKVSRDHGLVHGVLCAQEASTPGDIPRSSKIWYDALPGLPSAEIWPTLA
jgi:hypothetical protein